MSSLQLNLSNQANTKNAKRSLLSQFNFFVILGLHYLDNKEKMEAIPLSIDIDAAGEITINGLDEELIDGDSIQIYSDKKVTNSNDNS